MLHVVTFGVFCTIITLLVSFSVKLKYEYGYSIIQGLSMIFGAFSCFMGYMFSNNGFDDWYLALMIVFILSSAVFFIRAYRQSKKS